MRDAGDTRVGRSGRVGRTPRRSTAPVEPDVCVVGLGGSGLAAVGAALEAGARVVGIDAGPVAGGAAGRNGGFLLAGGARFHHDAVAAWGEERAVGIYEESLAELDRLAAELGPEIVRRVGSLRIPASPEEEAEDCARAARRAASATGCPARAADGPDAAPACSSPATARSSRSSAAGCSRAARWRPARACTATRRRRRWPATASRTPARRGALPRRRRLRRRLDRARCSPSSPGSARSSRLQMLATAPVAPGTIPCPVYDNWGYEYWQQLPDGGDRARRRARHVRRRRVGARGRAGRRGPGPARPAAARARRRRRAGHAPVGGRDRLHGGPAARLRRGAARRDRGRRALGPRQRARLGRRPRGDGDRARRRAAAARAAAAPRALGLTARSRRRSSIAART